MNEQTSFLPSGGDPRRPDLPRPTRHRWQPLRLGLVELFHYDSEEFWFHDGHLLLRGNNGTGKSKILALTLPFLFDAQLRGSRIEPDGDPGKRMAWNLLMNRHDRRIGYTWIEFGRLDEDGTPIYLTLGAGLSAVAARPSVDSWFFVISPGPQAPRVGQDLWLMSDQRVVLTRDRLKDALGDRGTVFDRAEAYRRTVDEHLFAIGAARFDALMDTLIQLRQPQLSRRPDEAALSAALTEALPPLSPALLDDVADALNQLDQDRQELTEFQALEQAVGTFEEHYRSYAAILSRRQARRLRQAQTEYDTASRERNTATEEVENTRAAEQEAETALEMAETAESNARQALDTLRDDPANADADRLSRAQIHAREEQDRAKAAKTKAAKAKDALDNEYAASAEAATRADKARSAITARRAVCEPLAEAACVSPAYTTNALGALALDALATQKDCVRDALSSMEVFLRQRRDDVRLVRNLISEYRRAEETRQRCGRDLSKAREAHARARTRRDAADTAVEDTGRRLVDGWATHFANLRQLTCESDVPLIELAEWVLRPEGDNPAELALREARRQAETEFVARDHEAGLKEAALTSEREELKAEREALTAGQDTAPPAPPARGADTRYEQPGAPLWQLVDFQPHVPSEARAGLEAALEGAGLLDAWVTPDGALLGPGWLDAQLISRPAVSGQSLADWLCVDGGEAPSVQTTVVEHLLKAVSCGADDPAEAETWVAPNGRYRVGALAGTWQKDQAIHIGHAARMAARDKRLAAIDARLEILVSDEKTLAEARAQLAQNRAQAAEEERGAPSDTPLHEAHREADTASQRLRDAEGDAEAAREAFSTAERHLGEARDKLEWDAGDLGLPATADSLNLVEDTLSEFAGAFHILALAVHEWLNAWQELERQKKREEYAQEALAEAIEDHGIARTAAENARVAFETLRDSVGKQVAELQERMSAAKQAVDANEQAAKRAHEALRKASAAHAAAESQAGEKAASLKSAEEARTQAIVDFQGFARSGLLASALPGLETPDQAAAWTIDPALALARRVEQHLADEADDEARWERIRRALMDATRDLQQFLSALGHYATSDATEFGLVVRIVYENRSERPDSLIRHLAEEIAARSELLTAREREVLENHLEADIATEVQRLLQDADKQVQAINEELNKRPTSTGMRYRLQWLPLTEDEGAPAGLSEARKRLLNISPHLWTEEDRQVVGQMFQQRIAAERDRADAGAAGTASEGGTLADMLARALDYRRWHRFRVQRYQEGGWKKLTGPASSGERALGLTVPLFAALASFYGRGKDASPHAPRLILLDEAFAGIDDTARAHCMALIREFDLDFVITSEREWACYAALPGVSICHLQRREGIDAVHVSRWTWDGRERRREADPDRRFPAV